MNTIKFNYYYDEYYNDVATLVKRFEKIPYPHVVSIYRGSLPLGTHLSNALDCPLSIVKYQSYEGQKQVKKDSHAEWILNLTEERQNPNFFPHLIVVDDIYDTGATFRAVLKLPEFENNPDFTCMALYGTPNGDRVHYLHEKHTRWIVFPWERIKGGM